MNSDTTPTEQATTDPVRPAGKRALIMDCARELFQAEGFHATGVDRILERAGVAKMTLYNNFGSKDQLIVDVLDTTSEAMLLRMRGWIGASDDPFEQIMLLFDGLAAWNRSPEHCGCLMQAAAAEYSGPGSDVAEAVRRHYERVRGFFVDLAGGAEFSDANGFADQLSLLFAGAQSAARVCRTCHPAETAKRAAAILLEDACRRH